METCTVEVGLLKKKPCGHPSVTHCQTCEQPLCKDHAVAQTNEAGHKTGKFMCKECDAARREFEKTQAKLPPPAAKKAEPAPKPAEKKPEEKKPEEKTPDSGGLDFEPTKK